MQRVVWRKGVVFDKVFSVFIGCEQAGVVVLEFGVCNRCYDATIYFVECFDDAKREALNFEHDFNPLLFSRVLHKILRHANHKKSGTYRKCAGIHIRRKFPLAEFACQTIRFYGVCCLLSVPFWLAYLILQCLRQLRVKFPLFGNPFRHDRRYRYPLCDLRGRG